MSSQSRGNSPELPFHSAGMKQRLLGAAEAVFHEKGYQATRVSDIVARAGAAQGSFYLHFKNKQAVFLELMEGFFTHLLAQTLGKHPVEQVASQEEMATQLREIWTTLIEFCRARPKLTRLILDETASLPVEDRQRLAGQFEIVASALADYTRRSIRAGLVKQLHPELVGWVIVGMIERALHFAVFMAPKMRTRDIVSDLVAIELTGLFADPGSNGVDNE